MISHGEGFQIRHVSGRYYRSELIHFGNRVSYAEGTFAEVHELVSNPFRATLIYSADHWRRYLLNHPDWASVADQFEVVSGPGCSCCGERGGMMLGVDGNWRCDNHHDRNPCAIEGCKRTKAAPALKSGKPYLANDQWLCSDHWRRFVPPRSKLRQHYHLIFRRAKREGWTPELERRFWRYWTWLVAQARRKATDGDLNIAEIERMFGL